MLICDILCVFDSLPRKSSVSSIVSTTIRLGPCLVGDGCVVLGLLLLVEVVMQRFVGGLVTLHLSAFSV